MFMIDFPDPRTHEFSQWAQFGDYIYNTRDIIGFGGDMTVENLRSAYSRGIFPWPMEGVPLPWFCPERRAVLDFDELHIPRSLAKVRRQNLFSFTIDRAFRQVVETCAEIPRGEGNGSWITPEYIEGFLKLQADGMAHSVEAWDAEGNLAGGLYGVDAGGVFCGESMFHNQSNASKLSVLFLVDHLRARGSDWIDIEVMTPHFKALGAKEISRREFLDRLGEAQKLGLKLF